ncbi:D-sedoheptulose 7-phosphate isomerase [Candidatus Woesearchaeota archaeon]|nr:D-sedoheptulose 7-phosphate isomerase [Candidatus Woesearchaeota archaeon]
MQNKIKAMIEESAETKKMCAELAPQIERAAKIVVKTLKNKKKILLAGNGGSATQASHIAAEFVGRYKLERKGLPAIAFTADLAAITSIGNDYGFNAVFERQIEALGNKGDVFIALSTSGNSQNIINAVEKAKKIGIKVIGLLGKNGGKMKNKSDVEMIVPSENTPRIQEAHLMILHIICELAEKELFGK